MAYHLRAGRLASGILFAAANPLNAKFDIPPSRVKVRNASPYNPTQLADSAGQDVEIAGHTRDEVGVYSLFSVFDDATSALPRTHSPANPTTFCLPILSISVDVTIDGMVALTKLTQSFYNPSEFVITEARHTFPLYDGAAVTSFDCSIGNERRLQGVVKAKAQARRDFEEHSYKKREAAALLEELTPEISETSLGNIPGKTTVQISLTYVQELQVVTSQTEKAEGLAITIPTSIAPRYGAPSRATALPELSSDKLNINIKVLDNGTIDPKKCHVESLHPATYQGTQPVRDTVVTNAADLSSLDLTSESTDQVEHLWQYSESQPPLRCDFIMVIHMHEESRLRSRAFITPIDNFGHAALMVNLRPNDIFGSAILPHEFKGEVLFVLDRSGSMGWTGSGSNTLKIDAMKDAMSLALSGLPLACKFNIISFGSEVRGLWLESHSVSDTESMTDARTYVSTIESNMGGTDILLALTAALKKRDSNSTSSTQIILITDGEVEHEPHNPIFKFVLDKRKELVDKVRFFTLGLGDRVSHRVVESIAELGGGYCDVIDPAKKPRWEDRLNRMLLSVMEPDSWSCDVDLGAGYERQSLAAHQFWGNDQSDKQMAVFAQGPHPVPTLHPYRYKSLFFLLQVGISNMPKTVTITTTAASAKRKVYALNVEPTYLKHDTIHPMAVKSILQSLENECKRGVVDEEQAKTNAEFLGTRYAVTSKWTSFVAVADEDKELPHEVDIYKAAFREANIETPRFEMSQVHRRVNRLVLKSASSANYEPYHRLGAFSGLKFSRYSPTTHKSYESRHRDSERESRKNERRGSDGRLDSRREADTKTPDPSPAEAKKQKKDLARPEHADDLVEIGLEPKGHDDQSPISFMHLQRPMLLSGEDGRPPPSMSSRLSMPPAPPVVLRQQAPYEIQSQGFDHERRIPQRLQQGDSFPEDINFVVGETSMSRMACCSDDNESDEPCKDSCPDTAYETHPFTQLPVGAITWKHAARFEEQGLFVLPGGVQASLHKHFCPKTVGKMHESLRDLPPTKSVKSEEHPVLIDTLLMIQYFKTHLADQEDYWNLVIGKAERTVLLALGLDENQEEPLEPLYDMLSSAISHAHFLEAVKDSSVSKILTETPSASPTPGTCLVCDMPIDKNDEETGAASRDFVCLADECYDTSSHSRVRYPNWTEFWAHQIQSGHLICPDVSDVQGEIVPTE
ncbi:hypothetical protein PFICI_05405 [Pestalotiopsis fici W106-1]|uniref:VIT domain-containing protein n=1 Tax=Pestalotiopsis fici (strain W106-1 / CGMCC3.15140) TaxID=1229662 RepID=W3XBX8_PESFW|nr:uncharacterized protein PFICI_05405 [Pestalotiopsis fici W106-1]ETS83529.1 hypothetical protein PFICI_05405 [Pestalotiopsis fici W106-1]